MLGQAATMFISFPASVTFQFSTHTFSSIFKEVCTFTGSSAAILFFRVTVSGGVLRIFAPYSSRFFKTPHIAGYTGRSTPRCGIQSLLTWQAPTVGSDRSLWYVPCFSQCSSHCGMIIRSTRAQALPSSNPMSIIHSTEGHGMRVMSRVRLTDWNVCRLCDRNGETMLAQWPRSGRVLSERSAN
jgi:hypothetical protein